MSSLKPTLACAMSRAPLLQEGFSGLETVWCLHPNFEQLLLACDTRIRDVPTVRLWPALVHSWLCKSELVSCCRLPPAHAWHGSAFHPTTCHLAYVGCGSWGPRTSGLEILTAARSLRCVCVCVCGWSGRRHMSPVVAGCQEDTRAFPDSPSLLTASLSQDQPSCPAQATRGL